MTYLHDNFISTEDGKILGDRPFVNNTSDTLVRRVNLDTVEYWKFSMRKANIGRPFFIELGKLNFRELVEKFETKLDYRTELEMYGTMLAHCTAIKETKGSIELHDLQQMIAEFFPQYAGELDFIFLETQYPIENQSDLELENGSNI